MDYIEMTGKTINEAVDKAKEVLGLGYDEIDYKILEEPRKGFLGIGAKPAKVLVMRAGFDIEQDKRDKEEAARREAEKKLEEERKRREREEAEAARKAKAEEAERLKKEALKAKREEQKTLREADKPEKQPKPKKQPRHKELPKKKETEAQVPEVVVAVADAEPEEKVEINTDKAVADASAFLKEVFGAMNMSVEVEKQEESGRQLYLNLIGDDMGVIIGKRGQTLDSLQYLTNLIVNKGNSPYISVHLDTKDYRKKRKETLENLAKNLAKKAKHIRRNVILEPMNPYERRIIHSTLQNDRYVTTFSEGEEPYRHIVISPKYK